MTKPIGPPKGKIKPPSLPKWIEEATESPVSIIDAKKFHCRAVLDQRDPNGRAMFCGAHKMPGSPWCARHKRMFVNTVYVGRA